MIQTKVSIGLINPKSPENVSSVMRAAGNFNVDSVFYTGKRYPRALKLKSCSVDMSRKVSKDIPLSAKTDLLDDAPAQQKIVCIEFAENAVALPEYEHPRDVLYVFGPEDGSISQDIIDRADAVVFVPTSGCMNLAATVNVVLYDRLSKSYLNIENDLDNNTLICQSRDINNSLKVSL